jgi:hypothetical protein
MLTLGTEINKKTSYSRRSLPRTLVVGSGPINGPPICPYPSQFFQNALRTGPPTPARNADVYLIRMTCFGNAVRQPRFQARRTSRPPFKMDLHLNGTLFAHPSWHEIAKLAVARPELPDAGSVAQSVGTSQSLGYRLNADVRSRRRFSVDRNNGAQSAVTGLACYRQPKIS